MQTVDDSLKDADVRLFFFRCVGAVTYSIFRNLQKVCARAEYHFDASLRYIDSDGATVASSSTCEKQSFNLSQWRSGYAQTHSFMLARMFFA
jgi:hypothetical protein